MSKQFNPEAEFQEYCKRVRLDLENCSPTQVIETRRAFYAGIGNLLVFLREDLSTLDEEDGVAELDRIWNKVGAFWKRQAGL